MTAKTAGFHRGTAIGSLRCQRRLGVGGNPRRSARMSGQSLPIRPRVSNRTRTDRPNCCDWPQDSWLRKGSLLNKAALVRNANNAWESGPLSKCSDPIFREGRLSFQIYRDTFSAWFAGAPSVRFDHNVRFGVSRFPDPKFADNPPFAGAQFAVRLIKLPLIQ